MRQLDRVGTIKDFYESIKKKQGRDRWFYAKNLNLTNAEVNIMAEKLVLDGYITEHPLNNGCYLTDRPFLITPATAKTEAVDAKETAPAEKKLAPEPILESEEEPELEDYAGGDLVQEVLYYLHKCPGSTAGEIAKHFNRPGSNTYSQAIRQLVDCLSVIRISGALYIRTKVLPEPPVLERLPSSVSYNLMRRIKKNSDLFAGMSLEEIRDKLCEIGDLVALENLKQQMNALVRNRHFKFESGKYYPNEVSKEDAVAGKNEAQNSLDVPVISVVSTDPDTACINDAADEVADLTPSPSAKAIYNPLWVSTLTQLGDVHRGVVRQICDEIIDHLKSGK